jgi:dTDP-glucose 4,6-dehydratase
LVTGGAGFIGSSFVRRALAAGREVVVLDALTYAGHPENLSEPSKAPGYHFEKGRIEDFELVSGLFKRYQFQSVVHFAAESHVDNSIQGPRVFVETNIMGTFSLLEAARGFLQASPAAEREQFRFVHVSTDEVFGELGQTGFFDENSPYRPQSPYSASKAASDHLVRAWANTYSIPSIVTNCSNNYGPRQFPEKLIPRMIQNALRGEGLPVYGKGENIRDWIHVEDHCDGVFLALTQGTPGESYCFGGRSERTNLAVVQTLCDLLQELRPREGGYRGLIRFVEDRAGHDFRYAIDDSFARKTLGFQSQHANFEDGLRATVRWYLDNQSWVEQVSRSSK